MDKISLDNLQHSQMQVIQQMQSLAGAIAPADNNLGIAASGSSSSFSTVFQQGLRSVDNLQHSADSMQRAVDMGESDDLMGTMLESQKASISFSAMVEVRNKLVTALEQLINTSL